MKLGSLDPRLPLANPWGVGETPYVFAPGAQRGQSWELETDIWEVDIGSNSSLAYKLPGAITLIQASVCCFRVTTSSCSPPHFLSVCLFPL
jgi:hypothetical protein